MLTVSNLNVWLKSDNAIDFTAENKIINNVSFAIQQGQTTALVGESGSGKSVTALTILRLLEESCTVKTEGAVTFKGKELLGLSLADLRSIRGNLISMIFQEPMTSLNPVYPVGNQIMEPLRLHQKLEKKAAEMEAINLLERTGIDNPEDRFRSYPHQLSGGQRQRVMIAMALACRPALLIADEPTTALDVTIQAQILELIKNIQKEYGMGLLLITHDLMVVKSIADSICIMRHGQIIEKGPTRDVFNNPGHHYTRNLMSPLAVRKKKTENGAPTLMAAENLSCSFNLGSALGSVFKKHRKTIHAVNQVNFTVEKGCTCGIVGESGSGKSTLALALMKLVKSSGTISYNGVNLQKITGKALRDLRSSFQIVFQDPFSSLSPRLTIGQIVEEGLRVHRKDLNRRQRQDLVVDTLEEVGLNGDITGRFPHEFSGGQRQRIAIARVIILNPQLLILDEPTSALDMTIQTQVLDLLYRLQEKLGLTYIFISHDLRVVQAISDYVIVMRHGKIVEAGNTDEIMENPTQTYTRELFRAAFTGIH